MAVIAVAGGTGSIGRSIVEAVVEAGNFEVIVLSRKVRDVGGLSKMSR